MIQRFQRFALFSSKMSHQLNPFAPAFESAMKETSRNPMWSQGSVSVPSPRGDGRFQEAPLAIIAPADSSPALGNPDEDLLSTNLDNLGEDLLASISPCPSPTEVERVETSSPGDKRYRFAEVNETLNDALRKKREKSYKAHRQGGKPATFLRRKEKNTKSFTEEKVITIDGSAPSRWSYQEVSDMGRIKEVDLTGSSEDESPSKKKGAKKMINKWWLKYSDIPESAPEKKTKDKPEITDEPGYQVLDGFRFAEGTGNDRPRSTKPSETKSSSPPPLPARNPSPGKGTKATYAEVVTRSPPAAKGVRETPLKSSCLPNLCSSKGTKPSKGGKGKGKRIIVDKINYALPRYERTPYLSHGNFPTLAGSGLLARIGGATPHLGDLPCPPILSQPGCALDLNRGPMANWMLSQLPERELALACLVSLLIFYLILAYSS